MKFKIEDIRELSDSRQVMEAKPHKFTSIFIYILLAAIFVFITWAWFSEKEVVVKVSGIVKPVEESYAVSNIIAGKVKEVNMKNGQEVTKGDTLYKIDDSAIQDKKNIIEDQKIFLDKDIKNLEKLRKSVNENTNLFSDSEDEKEYYYKYQNYETGSIVSLSDKNDLATSKDELNEKISKLETLSKSIDEDKDYNERGSIYSDEFNNYIISKKTILDKIEKLEKRKKELEDQGLLREEVNIQKPVNQVDKENLVEQIEAEIETNKNALVKLKSDANIKVKNSINEIKDQIKLANRNINKVDEGTKLSKEKNKTLILSQIEEKLTINNEKLKEINCNMKDIEKNIEECDVKCNIDGKLDIKTNIEPGVMLQTGAMVANIMPKEDNYKIQLIISDKDIANIKDGEEIKYSFNSLPYNEYGFVKGTIENISSNSQVDNEKGLVFYTAEGSVENTIVYSEKGEKSEIKAGMTCEARIVTRRKRMLYYLLEKLNFIK